MNNVVCSRSWETYARSQLQRSCMFPRVTVNKPQGTRRQVPINEMHFNSFVKLWIFHGALVSIHRILKLRSECRVRLSRTQWSCVLALNLMDPRLQRRKALPRWSIAFGGGAMRSLTGDTVEGGWTHTWLGFRLELTGKKPWGLWPLARPRIFYSSPDHSGD